MKYFLILCSIAVLLIASWYIASEIVSTRTCYITYRSDLDDLIFRSQNNKSLYCKITYDKINALAACLVTTDTVIPELFRSNLQPVSHEIERLVGYRGKTISQLEEEHDNSCRDNIDTMFVPPVAQ